MSPTPSEGGHNYYVKDIRQNLYTRPNHSTIIMHIQQYYLFESNSGFLPVRVRILLVDGKDGCHLQWNSSSQDLCNEVKNKNDKI